MNTLPEAIAKAIDEYGEAKFYADEVDPCELERGALEQTILAAIAEAREQRTNHESK